MGTEPHTDASTVLARAEAAFEDGHVQSGIDILSSALRAATAAGDVHTAAMVSARLGFVFEAFIGNRVAARTWFQRAIRLLADQPDCVEQGWVALAGLGCDVDDPRELRARASLALDRARRFGDVDLEAKALADGGLARVQAGEVTEGMQMLDEAITLWCGPAANQDAASMGVCSFFTACYYAAEYDHAGQWLDDLRRIGLVGAAPGGQAFLSSHCDAVLATALVELGRWSEAESVLTRAVADFEACMPIPSWHPAIALADLRIRQGRLAEAETLLLGKEAHLQALLPCARLQLARGDAELAAAIATRGLHMVGPDVLRGAELLGIIALAELAAGRLEEARTACESMTERAAGVVVPRLVALVCATRARVAAAAGDLVAGLAGLELAVDTVPPGLPVLKACWGLELARLHERAGNRAAAAVEAGRAASLLAPLDVRLPSGEVDLLARLLSETPPSQHAQLRCELGRWTVAHEGVQARLTATKGLRYLAVLLSTPGVERHVLDLVDEVEGVVPDGPDRHRLGDAGELLDAAARQSLRRRVEELRLKVEESLADGEDARAAELQEECDALVAHLAAAFGLRGRPRRAASAAERARLNVTRSVRTAIARIYEQLPAAGEVLDRGVRTGQYCAFEPDPADFVRWSVSA